jgi:hypothetical protein
MSSDKEQTQEFINTAWATVGRGKVSTSAPLWSTNMSFRFKEGRIGTGREKYMHNY